MQCGDYCERLIGPVPISLSPNPTCSGKMKQVQATHAIITMSHRHLACSMPYRSVYSTSYASPVRSSCRLKHFRAMYELSQIKGAAYRRPWIQSLPQPARVRVYLAQQIVLVSTKQFPKQGFLILFGTWHGKNMASCPARNLMACYSVEAWICNSRTCISFAHERSYETARNSARNLETDRW